MYVFMYTYVCMYVCMYVSVYVGSCTLTIKTLHCLPTCVCVVCGGLSRPSSVEELLDGVRSDYLERICTPADVRGNQVWSGKHPWVLTVRQVLCDLLVGASLVPRLPQT